MGVGGVRGGFIAEVVLPVSAVVAREAGCCSMQCKQ